MNRPRRGQTGRRVSRRVVAAPVSNPSLTVVPSEGAPAPDAVAPTASVAEERSSSPVVPAAEVDLGMPLPGAAVPTWPAETSTSPEANPPRIDRRTAGSGGSSLQTPAEGSSARPGSRIEEFLGFQLDAEEYCVWIRSVKEIIKPSDVTPIPRSPRHILGLISLRGAIVPIFDIRRRLGLPDRPVTPQSRVVVFMLDTGAVGIVVDRVTEVMSTDPGALESPPPTLGECEASFVTATLRFKQRLIGVLHLDRLVTIASAASVRAGA